MVAQVQACQAVGNYLLAALRDVCDRHSIPFYLDAGTLLGAVRHKGWIPWDDDVDVLMYRQDFIRLLMWRHEFPTNVCLTDPRTGTLTAVPRLLYLESEVHAPGRFGIELPELSRLALDLFLVDRGPRSPALAHLWLGVTRLLQTSLATQATTYGKIYRAEESFRSRCSVAVLKLLTNWVPPRVGSILCWRISDAFNSSKGTRDLFCLTHFATQRSSRLSPNWFSSNDAAEFEGVKYSIPTPGPYLRQHYGPEYMTPPPAGAQVPHKVSHLRAMLGIQVWTIAPEIDSPETSTLPNKRHKIRRALDSLVAVRPRH